MKNLIVRSTLALALLALPAVALAPESAFNEITVRSIKGIPFGGAPTRIIIGNNPDNQIGWGDAKAFNPIGFYVDIGNYGNPSFSGLSIPEAITGGIAIPADANLAGHASAIAGYAKTYAKSGPRGGNNGAVGVFGRADSYVLGGHAWGINTVTGDNGIKTNALWGAEIDVNVTAAGTFARGIDVVGGSTQPLDAASPAIIVQAAGIFAVPKIPWGRGLLMNDGAASIALEIGTANESTNSPSMPIISFYRDDTNMRKRGYSLVTTGAGDTILKVESPTGLFQLNGKASFNGNVGFYGAAPVARPKLPPPATDAASTQTLVNAIRAALIANGLAR